MAKTNPKSKSTKKRKVIIESVGEAHVTASFNNIIISLTNKGGDVISWSSAGKMGFRGSKKNTPYSTNYFGNSCRRYDSLHDPLSNRTCQDPQHSYRPRKCHKRGWPSSNVHDDGYRSRFFRS